MPYRYFRTVLHCRQAIPYGRILVGNLAVLGVSLGSQRFSDRSCASHRIMAASMCQEDLSRSASNEVEIADFLEKHGRKICFEDRLLLQTVSSLSMQGLASGTIVEWEAAKRVLTCKGPPDGSLVGLLESLRKLCQCVDAECDHASGALAEAIEAWEDFARNLRVVTAWLDNAPLQEGARVLALLLKWRFFICSLYSCGVLDRIALNDLVMLLREQLGVTSVMDPLAGSGWHGAQLSTNGLPAHCSDEMVGPVSWVSVVCEKAEEVRWLCADGSARSALWLSWPPPEPHTIGAELLRRYSGDVVVYFGEISEDSVTGTPELLQMLESEWKLCSRIDTPRWPGFQDAVFVYKRRRGIETKQISKEN